MLSPSPTWPLEYPTSLADYYQRRTNQPPMKSLRVATCQFSVEADIEHNRRAILQQITQATRSKADIIHFSECALSGYVGVDLPDLSALDWDQLTAATLDIQAAAKEAQAWVLLGSTHRLSGKHNPHNSVYVIDPHGKIVDRYDKRFCTGTQKGKKTTLDLMFYTPGDHFVTFKVKGVTCGILICYDYRFPELYRHYYQLGAKVIFQSFHNARTMVVEDQKYNIWKTIVPATMSCRAAENHFWISANNSTTHPSRWGSFTVQPDGLIVGKLKLHCPGILITEMKLDPDLFDAPGPWRDAAIRGQLHSGKLVKDKRSSDVKRL